VLSLGLRQRLGLGLVLELNLVSVRVKSGGRFRDMS
jgi:hypothetical protein